ncbi:conserved hypothetical protein [Talaromyces stipitatus ATCC 10500]|uniref:Uncharacterized protein n=1 Tax=Talaromyces stipitatus (strain ATCC 10500 / CBS 375.48 / QM 6759 / NRRL 1006) TaxID=441959 RepID=B8M7V5_TALSN|nr:uncharacterized protein TSTA_030990 [Talaromyces stipitatus ATCC 10500]EED19834.1 conserved hypothetical protein [Talaromyces stipitatus ATCC 10500]
MGAPTVNYPTVVPAINQVVDVVAKRVVGVRENGPTLIHFEFGKGTLETVEGFEPAFKAEIFHGADWLSFDSDEKHARIDVKAVAQTEDGETINFPYHGVVTLDKDVLSIFNMEPTSKTIPFGASTNTHYFHCGSEKLKELENMTFIGNSRMIVNEETRAIQVETRISRVIAATGME